MDWGDRDLLLRVWAVPPTEAESSEPALGVSGGRGRGFCVCRDHSVLAPCPNACCTAVAFACSEALAVLKDSKRPMVIVGPGVLQRPDRAALMQKVSGELCVCMGGWVGWGGVGGRGSFGTEGGVLVPSLRMA